LKLLFSKPQLKQNDGICLVGHEYWLKEAWQTLFKPNLLGFAINIEPIITNSLQRAQWLLNSVNKSNENFCSLSYGRSAIEPHEQDQFSKDIDILIDAARDILEYLLANNSKYAQKLIEAWSSSEVIILRRLAIHDVTENNQLTPDHKITWIIENNLKVYENETLYITIPEGIDDNEIILLEGKGNIGHKNLKGDVKIFVKIENKTLFERKGLDLYYVKHISLKESLCGFCFDLLLSMVNIYLDTIFASSLFLAPIISLFLVSFSKKVI
jgi:hypothetical protein